MGAVGTQNWPHMLAFAEQVGRFTSSLLVATEVMNGLCFQGPAHCQVGCTLLAEAAMMTGLRQLLPHLLASFRIPTGLEGANKALRARSGKEMTLSGAQRPRGHRISKTS